MAEVAAMPGEGEVFGLGSFMRSSRSLSVQAKEHRDAHDHRRKQINQQKKGGENRNKRKTPKGAKTVKPKESTQPPKALGTRDSLGPGFGPGAPGISNGLNGEGPVAAVVLPVLADPQPQAWKTNVQTNISAGHRVTSPQRNQ